MMDRKEQIKRFYEEVVYTRLIKQGCTPYQARNTAVFIVENCTIHSLILGP